MSNSERNELQDSQPRTRLIVLVFAIVILAVFIGYSREYRAEFAAAENQQKQKRASDLVEEIVASIHCPVKNDAAAATRAFSAAA